MLIEELATLLGAGFSRYHSVPRALALALAHQGHQDRRPWSAAVVTVVIPLTWAAACCRAWPSRLRGMGRAPCASWICSALRAIG
jgi:hypothetical protein